MGRKDSNQGDGSNLMEKIELEINQVSL